MGDEYGGAMQVTYTSLYIFSTCNSTRRESMRVGMRDIDFIDIIGCKV